MVASIRQYSAAWTALVLSVIAMALMLAVPLDAQHRAQDKDNYEIIANIDYPSPNATLSRTQFWIGGWAFNATRGGQQPHSIRVYLASTTLAPTVIPTLRVGPVPRPDVKAYFASIGFQEMSSYTGVHLVPTDPASLPIGTFVVSVELTDSYGTLYLHRTVTLVE
jgi:hypothetical protein